MGMPSLPDVDIGGWLEYQGNEFRRKLDEQISQFGLGQAIDQQLSQLDQFRVPEPPPPLPPAPEPLPMPAPEPEPQPQPAAWTPEPAPAPAPRAMPRVASPPPAPPPPTPAPVAGDPLEDWKQRIFGQGLNAVRRAGGDPQAFADDFSARLQSGVSDAQGAFGQALNAAQRSGADVQAFATTYRPLEPPRPEPVGMETGGPVNPNPSPEEVRAYIVQAAQARGIDPNIALRVANSEGGMEAARRGTFKTGSSWWPFQLHYGGQGYEHFGTKAGMGNSFTAQTGYQPGDPNAWQAATDYALDAAKKNGWGAWYGAEAQGITGFTGIDRKAADVPFVHKVGETLGGAAQSLAEYAFPVQGYKGKVDLHWGKDQGGSDIFATPGTPVVAMRGGKVTSAGSNAIGGNYVTIQGDDGNQYYYAHLDRAPAVRAGQIIQPGAYLGGVGDTGNAKGTGAHLHLGIGPEIVSGTGPTGGTGGGFDAVGLLRNVLAGEPVESVTASARGAGQQAWDTVQRGLERTAEAAQQRIERQLGEWEAESQRTFERGRSFAEEQLRNLGAPGQAIRAAMGETEPYSDYGNLGPSTAPGAEQWDTMVRELDRINTAAGRVGRAITPAGGGLSPQETRDLIEAVQKGAPVFLEALEKERQQSYTPPWERLGKGVEAAQRGDILGALAASADTALSLSSLTGPAGSVESLSAPLATALESVGMPSPYREILGLAADVALPGGGEFAGPTRGALRAATREAVEAGQRAAPEVAEAAGRLATSRLPAQAEVGFAMGMPSGRAPEIPGAAATSAPPGAVTGPAGTVFDSAVDAAEAARLAGGSGIHLERKPGGGFGWAPGAKGERLLPATEIDDPLLRAAAEDADKIIAERVGVASGKLPVDPTSDDVRTVFNAMVNLMEQTTDRRVKFRALEDLIEKQTGEPMDPDKKIWLRSRVFEGRSDLADANLERMVKQDWRKIGKDDRLLFEAFLEQMDNPGRAASVGRRVEREVLERPLRRVAGSAAVEEADRAYGRAQAQLRRIQKMEAAGRAPGKAARDRAEANVVRMQERLEQLEMRAAGQQAANIESEALEAIMREPLRLNLRDASKRFTTARRAYKTALDSGNLKRIRATERELDAAEWQHMQASAAAREAGDLRAERITERAVGDIEQIAERGPRETPAIARAKRDVQFAEERKAAAERYMERTGSDAAQKQVDQADARLIKAQEKLREATDWAEEVRFEQAREAGEQARTERKFSGGARAQDIDAVRETWRRRLGDDRFKTFEEAGAATWRTVNYIRDRYVDSGVWSKKQGDFFKDNFPYYIRSGILQANSQDAIDNLATGARTFAVGSDGIKKLSIEGTEKARQSPTSSLIDMMHEAESMAQRNELMRRLANWSDYEFMAPFVRRLKRTDDAPDGFVAKSYMDGDNGKQRIAVIKELESALDLSKPGQGPLFKLLEGLGMPLRLGATALRPGFIAFNAVNDLLWSLYRVAVEANGDVAEGVRGVGDLARGYAASSADLPGISRIPGLERFLDPTNVRERARLAGASIGRQSRYENPDDLVRELMGDHVWVRKIRTEGDIKDLLQDSWGAAGDLAGTVWSRPLAKVGKPIENAPRLGAFLRAERKGLSAEEAAMAARTATADFSAGGRLTKHMNALIPFLNATTQAGAEFGSLTRKHPAASAAAQATIIAGIVANEIYNRSVAPEEYEDVSRKTRDHGLVFMSDKPAEGDGKRGLGFIPLRGGVGALVPLVREAMGRAYGDDPRTWQALAKEVIGSVSPIEPDISGGAIGQFMPPPAKLGLELLTNHNLFMEQPIVPKSLETLPRMRQFNERTSQTARMLSNSNIPGFSGQSPMMIDYALKNFSPGPGEALLGAGDMLIDATGTALPELPQKGQPGARDLPVVGGILGRFLRTAGEERLGEAYDKADRIADDYRRRILDNVEQSPSFASATPERQRRILRSMERALVEEAQDLAGVTSEPRDLGLPNKYLGVKDPKREMEIDDAISAVNAWEERTGIKPTSKERVLARRYAERINPRYSRAMRRLEAQTGSIRRDVQRTLAGAGR